MWRINLFSHLEILYCNAPAAISLRGRKTGGLLAYLAVYSYRSHPREALAAALWDEDNADERGSLRASLAALRNKLREADLPDTLLCIERDAIRLNVECTTTDVTAFRERLQAAKTGSSSERRQQLESAIALYRGPLLAAFTEAWVHEERERLAASHQAALAELAELCWNAGDYEQALAFALRATHADPDDESAHLRLMQFYVDMGRASDALRQFRKLEYRVTRLGSPVSQAARALLERARKAETTANRRQEGTAYPASGSLLAPLTPFFGREEQQQRLRALLTHDARRLITLTGPGGCGKTRLAVETAREMQMTFAGRVFFVELADVRLADSLPDAVADAVLPRRIAAKDVLTQIAGAIREQSALLVLDNAEHLLEGVSATVTALLQRLPALRILVTSRRRLRLQAEQVVLIPLLPLPRPDISLEDAVQNACVQLFVDRARAAAPNFVLTLVNLSDVLALCTLLEGFPLALVLAAAWSPTRTPAEICADLTNRFALLQTTHADTPARHHSVWRALDWSYQQLPETLRRYFAGLSVFRGGWDMRAAQALSDDADIAVSLRLLQEHSLLEGRVQGVTTRFHLLETLRAFADAQLTPAERAAWQERHAACFLQRALEAEARLEEKDAEQALRLLDADRENAIAALDWFLAQGRRDEAQRLVDILTFLWERRGLLREGRHFLDRVLALFPEPTAARAALLTQSGLFMYLQGNAPQSETLLEEGLAIARQQDAPALQERTLQNLAQCRLALSDYAGAETLLQEALEEASARQDTYAIARALHALGSVHFATGRNATAQRYYERSLVCWRQLNKARGEARALLNLASILTHTDLEQAEVLFRRSRELLVSVEDDWLIGVVDSALGVCAYRRHDDAEAERWLLTARAILQSTGSALYVGITNLHLGDLYLRQGAWETARQSYETGLRMVRAAGERRRIAQALDAYGRLAAARAQWAQAARLMGAAEGLRAQIGAQEEPFLIAARDEARTRLQAALPAAELAATWAAGVALAWETAARLALEEAE